MAWTDLSPYSVGRFTAAMAELLRGNFKAIGDPWVAYTPTWTASGFTQGNGTIVGARILAGKLVMYRITATIGTTTTVGSSAYSFGLPVAAVGINMPGGGITVFNGSSVRQRDVYINTTTTVAGQDEAGTFVGGSAPFALSSGSTLKLLGVYEAA
jgi:hypothetical protein